MNVVTHLLAASDASRPALFFADKVLTHGELRDAADRLARSLLSSGLQKGDRVGLWSENNIFFVTAYLGIICAGLVVVPFQTDMAQDSFTRVFEESGAKAMLVSRRHAARLKPWMHDLHVPMLAEPIPPELFVRPDIQFPEIDAAQDLAALMFTSGSTGAPKGVMVTHQNIQANTSDIVAYMGLTQEDRIMVVLPFNYCFGLSLLHSHLMVGGSLVLNNQFMYPENVLEDMLARECTGLAGVPSTYQILLRKSRFKQLQFPSLRWLQQAGGKLPNPFIQEIIESFPKVRFYLMYGQTEATARLSYLPPERLDDKLGSIGKGLPSTRLEVLTQEGAPVRPGSDEVGEIVASGLNITLGYWNDPAETEKFFQKGRLRTGDLARVDSEGFIYVVERDREMIKSGGNRVSAKEVEDVISELPNVVEVAVIGVPHEFLGEAIKAFVVKIGESPLSAPEVIEHCRRRLPVFKSPESVEFLERLPHNNSGKVIKRKLKEMAPRGSA